MSIAARVPVASVAAANAALEAQGFGPDNFSVPVYASARPSFALLHAWGPPDFIAAVKALPGVEYSEATGTPIDRAEAVTPVGAAFAATAKPLTGNVTPGLHVDAEGVLWWVIQPYDTAEWPDPLVIPSQIRPARIPGQPSLWVQPLDQFDAYLLVDPWTGQPEEAFDADGVLWYVTQGDGAGLNTWPPGVFGWARRDGVPVEPPPPPPVSGWVDSGVTVTSVSGANLLAVSDTGPLPVGTLIRVNGVEATVSSIFTSGAPGLLVTSVNLPDTPGSVVERWVE
jgi:hypothetical protein